MAEVSGASKNMLILDYSNSEAIGIGMLETKNGSYSAGLSIVERMPLDADIAKVGTSGPERIGVSPTRSAARASASRARRAARGGIELLDEKGAVGERWP